MIYFPASDPAAYYTVPPLIILSTGLHHLISILLTLLIFLTGGNLAVAKNQASSAPLGDLCASSVRISVEEVFHRQDAKNAKVLETHHELLFGNALDSHLCSSASICGSNEYFLVANNQHSSASLGDLCALAVNSSSTCTTTGPVATIIPTQTQSFTVNDRLTTDSYDANGNTTESRSVGVSPTSSSDIYSFDNKLIRRTNPDGKTIDLTYNPDGHRLSKFITQNALTQRLVHYLTDANNPTGYAQVIEEKHPLEPSNQQLKKVNLYGHDLICSVGLQPSSSFSSALPPPASLLYYNYDGLGSVRSITNATGDLQETYDYDAYGILIGLAKRNPTTGVLESTLTTDHSALLTQSEYLFTGEQYDSDLNMYFLRARYLNTNTGRFHTQDTYEGQNGEPITLHKYLYANGNPAMFTDPSGRFSLGEMSVVQSGLIALSNLNFKYTSAVGAALFNSLTQARLLALGGPLVYELDQLSRTLQPVSGAAAGKIVSLRNKIQDAISAPKVFFNVYFPAFLASLPGKYGIGASVALSAYRLVKLGAFFENIVAQAAEGASFNNGTAHFNASATVHPWSSGLSAFGAFGLGGTGATPALDVLYLNLGVQSVIGGDLQGGSFWMSEFSRSTSRYHLEVKGDSGVGGNNLNFGGNFQYNQ